MAPILAFTADEVWQLFPIEPGISSVHESSFLTRDFEKEDGLFKNWEMIRELRDAIAPSLERKREAKMIGSNLDAKIYIKTDHAELSKVLRQNLDELSRIFVVSNSQVYWLDGAREGVEETNYFFPSVSQNIKVHISVERADGQKCERCWNYSVRVGSFPDHPTLCDRCVEAISSI